jgi:hypothetical protein
MKQQEKPKSILNVFFRGGTRAKIGVKIDPVELGAKLKELSFVTLDTTNEDETIESETVTLDMTQVLFYSIQTPRIESDLVLAGPSTISQIHQ